MLLASIFQGLPLDALVSTQGIMVMLLVAYAGAMWAFLSSAPKVHTVMVTDLDLARRFYEGVLSLTAADVPLHYYYNYEQTLGTAGGLDPLYGAYSSSSGLGRPTSAYGTPDGLWYQLRKNTQLHVIGGASLGDRNRPAPCLLRPRLPRISADANPNERYSAQAEARSPAQLFSERL